MKYSGRFKELEESIIYAKESTCCNACSRDLELTLSVSREGIALALCDGCDYVIKDFLDNSLPVEMHWINSGFCYAVNHGSISIWRHRKDKEQTDDFITIQWSDFKRMIKACDFLMKYDEDMNQL